MVADYVAELGRLSKTCKFGDYLETALVCGSNDIKTQKELLCVKGLTLTVTINKARAAETVNREVQQFPTNVEALKISSQQYPCPRCGQQGHTRATCYYHNKCCRVCNKLGHAGAVCWQNQSQELTMKPQQKCNAKQQSKPMHTVASTVLNSDDEEFDNNQLSVH